jgi:VanZ family protein
MPKADPDNPAQKPLRYKAGFTALFPWAWAFFFAVCIGTVEEVLQLWTPGRVYDPRDLALNGCAVFFGLLLAACVEYGHSGRIGWETKGDGK